MKATIARLWALAALVILSSMAFAQKKAVSVGDLPDNIYIGGYRNHVQGIAADLERGYMYFSFTTSFVKTDLKGNVIGSIDRIQGHLGAMTYNKADGKVYASLECKDDEIGQGIAKTLGVKGYTKGGSKFYIAIIDVAKLNKKGMDPEHDPVFKTMLVKDAVDDYAAKVTVDGKELEHRYGCSGIDGVAIAPQMGKRGGGSVLYVAYGVYGDIDRKDNDYQVLLQYDLKAVNKAASTITFGQLSTAGEDVKAKRYFVYTGNTNWGVQNMNYDAKTGYLFMAVYTGQKEAFPNYRIFAVDVAAKPVRGSLKGVPYAGPQLIASLARAGLEDKASGVRGWYFPWGDTGLCSLGNGYWYIAEKGKTKQAGQYCNARLYHWTGNPSQPWERR